MKPLVGNQDIYEGGVKAFAHFRHARLFQLEWGVLSGVLVGRCWRHDLWRAFCNFSLNSELFFGRIDGKHGFIERRYVNQCEATRLLNFWLCHQMKFFVLCKVYTLVWWRHNRQKHCESMGHQILEECTRPWLSNWWTTLRNTGDRHWQIEPKLDWWTHTERSMNFSEKNRCPTLYFQREGCLHHYFSRLQKICSRMYLGAVNCCSIVTGR